MKSNFLKDSDHEKIVETIKTVEGKTTGEVRVRISHRRFLPFSNELRFARNEFNRLGIHKTPDRNGVLIMIFPNRRKLVVLGDTAIHQKMGQGLWDKTVATAIECFKSEEYLKGIMNAVEIVGRALAEHFPKTSDDADSLPNDVVEN